jgi:nucleoside-diphosphate-sugar epimerase
MRIAIAGSSGFIGNRLVHAFVQDSKHSVVALSRTGKGTAHERIECRRADFFSLFSAEKPLEVCEVAFYLLHSMIPSSRMTQGSFEDFDFILADNFGRAARKMGVKHII